VPINGAWALDHRYCEGNLLISSVFALSGALKLAWFALLLVQGAPVTRGIGVVTGQVRNMDGTPAQQVRVSAFSALDPGAVPSSALVNSTQTDAMGGFRLEALPPGRYYITAGFLNAQTHYPGVAALTDAKPITVTPGAAVSGIDFQLRVPTAGGGVEARPQITTPQFFTSLENWCQRTPGIVLVDVQSVSPFSRDRIRMKKEIVLRVAGRIKGGNIVPEQFVVTQEASFRIGDQPVIDRPLEVGARHIMFLNIEPPGIANAQGLRKLSASGFIRIDGDTVNFPQGRTSDWKKYQGMKTNQILAEILSYPDCSDGR
jgi:hypothetical protein